VKSADAVHFDRVDFSIGGVRVLQNVRFSVRRGEFLYMIGPNGGGKTTILKLILGLLTPESGNIRVLGGTPSQASPRVGYLPQYQHFDPKFPVTVMDVVLMGRLRGAVKPVFSRDDHAAGDEALEALGLGDLAGRPYYALSGGQRQRVLIARALVNAPELLLLDEPTSNVDVHIEEILFDLLERLNRTMTIILVTHDYGVVPRRVERVVCVNQTAAVHPTRRLTGDVIQRLYRQDLSRVHHDKVFQEKGKSRV
jgi:zinc transport system ATP-binding protein